MRSDSDDLPTLGVTNDIEHEKLSRRIEFFNKKQTLCTIFLYALCNIAIILCLVFGPPYYVSQKIDFSGKQDASATSRFSFDFTGLHFFNSFLTLDLKLNRTILEPVAPFNVTVFFHATTFMGTKILNKPQAQTISAPVEFQNGSLMSDGIRLFTQNVIKFNTIHANVGIKQPDGIFLPGIFEWNFADPSHSIIQIFLRLTIFIIALISFIRLLLSDFNLKTSHISMRFMFYLDILLIISSNPLYLLAFFTASPFFRLFDSLVNLFLAINTAYVALSMLMMRFSTYRDAPKLLLRLTYIAFLVGFALFATKATYDVMTVSADPLAGWDGFLTAVGRVSRGLAIAELAVGGVYLLALLVAAVLYKTDIPNEKPALALMGLTLVISVMSAVAYGALEPLAGVVGTAAETATLLAVAAYVLFFNFINWPVEEMIIQPEDDGAEIIGDLVGNQ